MDGINCWREMVQRLSTMTEEELVSAINIEVSGACRKTIVARLHQRYTKLRAARERRALLLKEMLL